MHPIMYVSLAPCCHFLSLGSKYTFFFPHSVVTLAQPRLFSQTVIAIFIPSQQEKHIKLQYFILTIQKIHCITEIVTILQDIYYPQFVNDTRLVWGHWSSRLGVGGWRRVSSFLTPQLAESSWVNTDTTTGPSFVFPRRSLSVWTCKLRIKTVCISQ